MTQMRLALCRWLFQSRRNIAIAAYEVPLGKLPCLREESFANVQGLTALGRFRSLRERAMAQARAHGIYTDEDVFKIVS